LLTASGNGGGYIQVNAKINGTWHDFGNTGDASVAKINASGYRYRYSISRFIDFDFIPDLGAGGATTIQIEVLAFFQNGSAYTLNTREGINITNAGGRGDLYMPGGIARYYLD
jgi:hypothetical protein